MNFSVVLYKMLLLMLTIAIGFAARKFGAMKGDFPSRLSRFLLNVTVPGALLSAGMSGDVTLSPAELTKLLGLAVLFLAVSLACAYAFPKLIGAEEDEKGTYRFLLTFSNTIFMGYPVATAFFGSSAVLYIAILTLPLNIAVFTVGPAMLTGKLDKGSGLKNAISPGTVTAVLAMLLIMFRIRVPAVIAELCSSVGSATSPIALIVIGANIADISFREIFSSGKMYLFALVRLVIMPAVVWAVFRGIVNDRAVLGCCIILAGLPSASMATLVSAQYGGNEKLASRGVMFSTLLSAVTIPVVMYILLEILGG